MDRDALIAEVIKLREGIIKDRDSSGHELCWYRTELWKLLPPYLQRDPKPEVPPWQEFIQRCCIFRASLDPPIRECK